MRAMSLSFAGGAAAALLLAACRPGVQATPPAAPIAAPAPQGGAVSALDAVGTEPFWSLQARPGRLLFQRMGEGAKPMAGAGPAPGLDGAIVWDGADLKLEVRPGECSDGMSDRVFPYAATVTLAAGEVLKGCAAPPGYFDGQPKP